MRSNHQNRHRRHLHVIPSRKSWGLWFVSCFWRVQLPPYSLLVFLFQSNPLRYLDESKMLYSGISCSLQWQKMNEEWRYFRLKGWTLRNNLDIKNPQNRQARKTAEEVITINFRKLDRTTRKIGYLKPRGPHKRTWVSQHLILPLQEPSEMGSVDV